MFLTKAIKKLLNNKKYRSKLLTANPYKSPSRAQAIGIIYKYN